MTIEHLLVALLILCVIAFVGAMLRPDKVTPAPRPVLDREAMRQAGIEAMERVGINVVRPSKGRQIERQIHTCIKDHGVVPIEAKFMVPLGYEVEHVGNAQGDVNWNNGQGYIVVKLSVTKAGEAP